MRIFFCFIFIQNFIFSIFAPIFNFYKMKSIIFLGFLLFSSTIISAQQVNQSTKIKELMEVKKEFSQSEKIIQIQIFNGKLNDANNELKNASSKYKLPITLSFETPNYKVRVGKFRSRIEANKHLAKIKTDYPAAFILDVN